MNTEKEPPLKIFAVNSSENSTHCITASHLLCDGGGFKELLYLIAKLYSGEKKNFKLNRKFSPDGYGVLKKFKH